MSGFEIEVQTIAGEAEAALLDGWVHALDASVREARRRAGEEGRSVRVTTVIADQRGAAGDGAPLDAGPVPGAMGGDGTAVNDWRVVRVPADRPRSVVRNELLRSGRSDLVLLIDPSVYPSPPCLGELIAAVEVPGVAMVEPRHIPLESRRAYDRASGDTSWVSSACCLVRRSVLDDLGGFDSAGFPSEGADIDLSWRARLAGWSVRYVPWAAAFLHFSDAYGTQVAGIEDIAAETAKLVLAAKFGGEPLAGAWATALMSQGTDAGRQAVTTFRARAESGRLPARIAGSTDGFLEELFGHDSLLRSPKERYEWDGRIAPRTREPSPPDPDETAAAEDRDAGPFLSVVVRTQGRRLNGLVDNLTSLASQTCQDFEVLLARHDVADPASVDAVVDSFPAGFRARVRRLDVTGGSRARPLNVAVGRATGRYLAFLDDDDVAFGTWVETFQRVADERPDAVVWTQVLWQTVGWDICDGRETWPVAEPPQLFVATFDLLAHLRENGTPNCGLAIPISCFREDGLRFREDLPVFEDWDLVLQVAQSRPIRSTGRITALYRRGSPNNSGDVHDPDAWVEASTRVLDDMDRGFFVVRGEYLPALRRALDELDEHRRERGTELPSAGAEPPTPMSAGVDGHVSAPVDGHVEAPIEAPTAKSLDDRRAMVVSPHLDDAVMSCGGVIRRLPGCVVLTVFAGDDVDWTQLTAWDSGSGFTDGTDVMAVRTAEDDRALGLLGATAVRLDFLDAQYRDPGIVPSAEALCDEIEAEILRLGVDTVFFPLGLGHVDHSLTAVAVASVARKLPHLDWFAYQDLPYAYEGDGVEEALAALGDMEPAPVDLDAGDQVEDQAETKVAAVDAYKSQMTALGEARRALALRPERYWKLRTSLNRAVHVEHVDGGPVVPRVTVRRSAAEDDSSQPLSFALNYGGVPVASGAIAAGEPLTTVELPELEEWMDDWALSVRAWSFDGCPAQVEAVCYRPPRRLSEAERRAEDRRGGIEHLAALPGYRPFVDSFHSVVVARGDDDAEPKPSRRVAVYHSLRRLLAYRRRVLSGDPRTAPPDRP